MRFYVVSSAAFRHDSIEKSCVMFPNFIQCISKAKCVFIPKSKGSGDIAMSLASVRHLSDRL